MSRLGSVAIGSVTSLTHPSAAVKRLDKVDDGFD